MFDQDTRKFPRHKLLSVFLLEFHEWDHDKKNIVRRTNEVELNFQKLAWIKKILEWLHYWGNTFCQMNWNMKLYGLFVRTCGQLCSVVLSYLREVYWNIFFFIHFCKISKNMVKNKTRKLRTQVPGCPKSPSLGKKIFFKKIIFLRL